MERDFINVPFKIEFEQRQSEYPRGGLGWYSRVVIAHILSDWQGPFESEKKAAAFWQQKLVVLAGQ